MGKEDILGTNQIEDVSWLCCLTESELDLLISLKMMVLNCAKLINHESLAKKFDLKILRALGFILMEYFKGKVKDLSDGPGLADICASLDGSNLLKQNIDGYSGTLSIEELRAFIGPHQRKRAVLMCGYVLTHHSPVKDMVRMRVKIRRGELVVDDWHSLYV